MIFNKKKDRAINQEDSKHALHCGQLMVMVHKSAWSSIDSLHDSEFKVFSQWGDDGIIQYLINNISIENKTFVEFGVEDYQEANTRFLMMHDNWSGLVIDSSPDNIQLIENEDSYWKYDLQSKCSFVTRDNINTLLSEAGLYGEIGLLHIDIDGNDYWIWDSITQIEPTIVIVEYNSLFGRDRAITIPYDPNFNRMEAHCSGLYAGASIQALVDLAIKKGYSFIGSNSAGNNAYFVKCDKLNKIEEITAKEGYVESKFRESRDSNGNLTFVRGNQRLELIKGMPVYNTRTQKMEDL